MVDWIICCCKLETILSSPASFTLDRRDLLGTLSSNHLMKRSYNNLCLDKRNAGVVERAKNMIKKLKSKEGQTLLEFALILMLLLILVFGIVEFGFIIYDKAMLTRASREGARKAAVFRAYANGNDHPWEQAEIETIVNNYLQNGLITFGGSHIPTTTITYNGTPPSAGGTDGTVTVNVAFTYNYLILPNLGSLGGGTLDLTATTIMRTE
jgi:Flp pilus assembly protein TadG